MFTSLDPTKLHHAYLVVGDTTMLSSDLRSFLIEATGRELEGNPDISWWKGESVGIDESRDLRMQAGSGAFRKDTKRIFVVESYAFTREAQNALLKTLEDPAPGIHFFILAPSRDLFLATLLSRFFILESTRAEFADGDRIKALGFLNAAPAKRLEMLATLVKKTDDPDEKKAQKRSAGAFLVALEQALREKLTSNPGAVRALQEISAVKPFLGETAGNPRLILEHLALVL
ncbi:MAG: hypothetical protein V4674_02545 [Patescibacteria group bacterium]